MDTPQYKSIQEEIRSLEEALTKHKFIVNSNTKLVREIKSFIDQNCIHHSCEIDEYDDGHSFGWDKQCVMCRKYLGKSFDEKTIPQSKLRAQIDRSYDLYKRLCAENCTSNESIGLIEETIYSLRQKISTEMCEHHIIDTRSQRCASCYKLII